MPCRRDFELSYFLRVPICMEASHINDQPNHSTLSLTKDSRTNIVRITGEMARLIALLRCVVVLAAMLEVASAQTTHVVLDNQGWTIPPGAAAAYTTWSASKTFTVGDTLVFNFANGRHDVAEVPQTAFDACTSTNIIGSIITNAPANITLTSAGEHYYICTFSEHCSLGQKLAITVSGSSSTASPPSVMTNIPPPVAGGPMGPPSSTSVVVSANVFLVIGSLVVILASTVATIFF